MSKKTLLGVGLALALFGLGGCGEQPQEAEPEPTASESAEAPAAELDNIPEVVAEVNGTEITGEKFAETYEGQYQQYAAQAQAAGQEPDQDLLKAQLADSMVAFELLVQEADRRQLGASPEEVDAALEELAAGSGMEAADALAMLKEQGMDEAKVREELTTQVKIDKLVAEQAGDTTPTEAELLERYESLAAQQEQAGGQELPAFEEVRAQLETQVRGEKESAATQELIAGLRESGDVTIHLEQPEE